MTAEARKMSRNLSLITINKVVQLMGGALWALIVPRWMGPEAYGQLALAMAISLLLWWLGDFGGLEVFGRYIPVLEERKPEDARQLFGQAFLLRAAVGLGLVPFMLVVGPLIAPFLKGWSAAFVGMAAGIHIISWTSYHLLYARKEMGKWAVELSWRLTTQLPLILLVGKWGLAAQMAAYTLNEVLYCALAIVWTKRWFEWDKLRPRLNFLRPYLRMGVGFWATNVGLILLFRTGTILVQLLTGDSVQVSYYDLALVVFFLVFTIIDQLVRSFLPTISVFKEEGEHERMGRWLQIVTQWGAALAVMAVLAVQYTADWIMPFILGQDYGDSAIVLRVMLLSLPALVLVGVGTVATAIRESARAKLIAITVGTALFWASSLFLGPRWGAVGVAWALTLGLNVYAFVLFLQIQDDLQLRWPALVGIVGLALPFLALRNFLTPTFLIALAATAGVSLLYLALNLLVRFLSPAPLQMLPALLRRDASKGAAAPRLPL